MILLVEPQFRRPPAGRLEACPTASSLKDAMIVERLVLVTIIGNVSLFAPLWMPVVTWWLSRHALVRLVRTLAIVAAGTFVFSLTQASDRSRYQWESMFLFGSSLFLLCGAGVSSLHFRLRDAIRKRREQSHHRASKRGGAAKSRSSRRFGPVAGCLVGNPPDSDATEPEVGRRFFADDVDVERRRRVTRVGRFGD